MSSLTAEPMMPPALERFRDELNAIYVVRRRHTEMTQLLEQEFEDVKQQLSSNEQSLYEAEAETPRNETLVNERKAKVKEDEGQLVFIRNELEIWKRESLRQIAIKYCIAFESFLRDFLVEQALLKPDSLESYICGKVSLPVSITKKLIEEDVVGCISVEYRDFQNLRGRVNDAYKKILNKKLPFGDFDESQNTFVKRGEWESAKNDILLLFKIRHQVIHRNGRVSISFSEEVNKIFKGRLNKNFKKSSKGIIPSADAILSSPAVVGSGDKIDEFAVSLGTYAEYITKICA